MKNKIAIVLDRSGSMYPITNDVIRVFNQQVEEIGRQAEKTGQDSTVTLITFANRPRLHYLNASPSTLAPLVKKDFSPDGSTALFDGVGMAIDQLRGLPGADDDQTSFLVIVLTDGEENNSTLFTGAAIARLMLETQKTDRWSFAFLVPPGHAKTFTTAFPIPMDNVREWTNDREGTKAAGEMAGQGIKRYYQARAGGQSQVKDFFVQTDLSALSTQQVKSALDDISDRFKEFEVTKEAPIKEFVEAKTKKPYVVGSAYYLLMKKETVQATKRVLIRERNKKAIWGGDQARQLIGLPAGKGARVTPGNHANHEIYIESRSVNRVLVRGTKVLVDVTQSKDEVPTWTPPPAVQSVN